MRRGGSRAALFFLGRSRPAPTFNLSYYINKKKPKFDKNVFCVKIYKNRQGGLIMKKKKVDYRHAQSAEYDKVLKKIEDEDFCPFCPENLLKNKKPITEIYRVGKWFLTENNYSYQEARIKLMIISDEHKENFKDLEVEDFKSVMRIVNWAIKEYNIRGGGLLIRFGNTQFTGATVCHLHFHLISPASDENGLSKPVYFPIG